MTRLNILLSMLLVVCALGLVTSQHRARKLFIDLEQANTQTQQHEIRWDQLQIDQTALGTASLIDAKARRGLSMQPATPQRTLHLTVDPTIERTAEGSVGRPGVSFTSTGGGLSVARPSTATADRMPTGGSR
ncbi:MAG: cell division protein FtsL [Pseudomonadota bacterium]|jgi:cell division protein FtsL